MMVEDHPFDYRNFEGIIPEGNYGAGTVIVWDEGTYEPIEDQGSKEKNENFLLKQLKAGSLKFSMHGKKLKGEFALVKTNYQGENSWLLIKHNDKYASTDDITKKEKSVISKKTIAQVEATSNKIWKSNRTKTTASSTKKVKKASSKAKA
jgi:bifunctional non-homologous end joining protein LigD